MAAKKSSNSNSINAQRKKVDQLPPLQKKTPAHPFDRAEEEKLMKEFGYCYLKKHVSVDINSIPFDIRLNIPRQTQLDRDTAFVAKPVGYIPHIAMPSWTNFPPDHKLSYIPVPPTSIPYSRGVAGEQLHRKCDKFHLDDPYNFQTGVSFPYDPLHDRYLRDFFERKRVHDHLVKQGLITDDNYVIENVKLMNEYRTYLFRTVYNDRITVELADQELVNKNFRRQLGKIRKFLSKTEGKELARRLKYEKVKREQFKMLVKNVKVSAEMKAADAHRLAEIQARKEEADYKRRLKNFEVNEERERKLMEKKRKELKDHADLVNKIAVLDYGIAERNRTDREMYNRTFKHYRMEWMDTKWNYEKSRIESQKYMEKVINEESAYRAEKRQQRVERQRKALPKILAKRKAKEAKALAIMRKYFNKWRAYVMLKRSSRPDAHHKSMWEFNEEVDETLKDLYKVSGYEKLDDFIMNIVMLKRKIQQELEAEEAAEAAAAANTADNDDDD